MLDHGRGIEELIKYLERILEKPGIVDDIERLRANRTSAAGTSREEIFNKEYVCPAVASYFLHYIRDDLDLTDEEIRAGLGAEGSSTMADHTFTPKLERDYFFTKGDILKSQPPDGWLDEAKLKNYRSYADFAVREPLPLSFLGELKYEHQAKSKQRALSVIYEATRQCVFYLGAFCGSYQHAFALIADASPGHIVYETFIELPEALRCRYGSENRLHLKVLRLR